MNFKPIIFSTPMVKAILDGRKTMTRRVVKVKPPYSQKQLNDRANYRSEEEVAEAAKNGRYSSVGFWTPWDGYVPHRDCPYMAGDILWVRETWYQHYDGSYAYRASAPENTGWKPSIHMPREAARIFLRVTDVRAERLQDMTPYDAWQEGCRIGNSFPWEEHIPELQQQCRDILFIPLWDNLNAKRGYGWDKNPWVWVISFERIDKPEVQ